MRRLPAAASVTSAVALAAVLVASACGSDKSSSGASSSSSSAPASSAATSPGSSSSAGADVAAEVTLKGGKPQGGTRHLSTKPNKPTFLLVTSDKAEEVHVHGADREVEVPANQPTRVDITEPAPGQYEVEIHSTNAQIAVLRVQ
jgi:ABC-type Fe3+-hydroxamate transport system substrate-binding protein